MEEAVEEGGGNKGENNGGEDKDEEYGKVV